MIRSHTIHIIWLLALFSMVPTARAADTTELWEQGDVNVDFYTGHRGMGLSADEKEVFGELMVGYGVGKTISAYLGGTLQGDGKLYQGEQGVFLGLYGTPLDTEHIDLDLFIDFSAASGEDSLTITPALELNLDSNNKMSFIGAYLRAGLPVYGISVAEKDSAGAEVENVYTRYDVEFEAGVYYAFHPGHMLFLQHGTAIHPTHEDDDSVPTQVRLNDLAIGYNFLLLDDLEVITEASMDIPQKDEEMSFGFFIGLIATLPKN